MTPVYEQFLKSQFRRQAAAERTSPMTQCAAGPKVMTHKSKKQERKDKAAAGFDYPTSLVGATPDGRCTVYYDPSLGAPGLKNAQDVLAWAPKIIAWHDKVFGHTGAHHNIIVADLGGTDGGGGAYHYGCDFSSGADLYLCAAFGNSALVAGLYAAELSECYMGFGTWGCGYSNGEGLSRRCADEVVILLGSPTAMDAYSAASSWNTADDWVSTTEQTDGDYDSIGCAVLAIDWLVAKGHTLASIAQAPGDTLASTYQALTGQPGSKFYPLLKAAVDALSGHITNDFPFSSTVPAPPPPSPQPQPPVPPGPSGSITVTQDIPPGTYAPVRASTLLTLDGAGLDLDLCVAIGSAAFMAMRTASPIPTVREDEVQAVLLLAFSDARVKVALEKHVKHAPNAIGGLLAILAKIVAAVVPIILAGLASGQTIGQMLPAIIAAILGALGG